MLLAKYSLALVTYINGIQNTKSKCKFDYFSWLQQNQLIEAMAQCIRLKISDQVRNVKLFSVSVDTTFNKSKKDQLSFVIGYFNEETNSVYERLLSIEQCSSTTAQRLLSFFKNICEINGLNRKQNLIGQSYDGA